MLILVLSLTQTSTAVWKAVRVLAEDTASGMLFHSRMADG